MQLRKLGTTLVFNPKAKTMVKMVQIFSLCFSVLAIFQQAGQQCFAYSSEYTSFMDLKICENLDREICDHFQGIPNMIGAQFCLINSRSKSDFKVVMFSSSQLAVYPENSATSRVVFCSPWTIYLAKNTQILTEDLLLSFLQVSC